MRILHVINIMNCGGAENMIMNIYRNIDREKIQFDFLVHSDKPAFFDEEIRNLGGRIFYVPRWNIINYFKYKKALHNFFKEHKGEFSWIHGHMGSSACIYLSIAKEYGIKTIAHSHNTNSTQLTVKNMLFRLFTLQTRKVAEHFFACSIDAGTDRFGHKIVNGNCFKIIKNALDMEKYIIPDAVGDQIKEEYNLKNHFVIGHIGRFNYQKNHLFLLDIFSELQKIKKDSLLLLLGEGELKNEIIKKATSLNILDKIVFTGVVPNANEFLKAMDCFAFPSFYEGLGMVAVEAQCVGLPCFINEKLPSDLDINPNVYRLSLNDSPKKWAETILNNYHNKINCETAIENVKNAGYDIKESVNMLECFYINL